MPQSTASPNTPSTLSIDRPPSSIRARFGLMPKSVRELSTSKSNTADKIPSSTLSAPHDSTIKPREHLTSPVGLGEAGLLAAEHADSPSLPYTAHRMSLMAGGNEKSSTKHPLSAKHDPRMFGDLSIKRHSMSGAPSSLNPDRAWRTSSAKPNVRHSIQLVDSESRQTAPAKSSARRSLPSTSIDKLRCSSGLAAEEGPASSAVSSPLIGAIKGHAVDPISSPGRSTNGTQRNLACHGCNDKGAYAMKEPMMPCATCWRQFHQRCAPKWQSKELELLKKRELPRTLGQPNWICRKCLQKNRKPGPVQIKDDRLVKPVLSQDTSGPSDDPELDAIPSIETDDLHDGIGEQPSASERPQASQHDGSSEQPLANQEDGTNEQLRARKDDGTNEEPPSKRAKYEHTPDHILRLDKTEDTATTNTKPTKQSSDKLPHTIEIDMGNTGVLDAMLSHTADHLMDIDDSADILRLSSDSVFGTRQRTESVIGDASTTLLDILERRPTPSIEDTAKALDQHELQELRPSVDTVMNNANDPASNPTSSSDKQSQNVASMPSPDSLASINDGLIPPEIATIETKQILSQASFTQPGSSLGVLKPVRSVSVKPVDTVAQNATLTSPQLNATTTKHDIEKNSSKDHTARPRPQPISGGKFFNCKRCGRKLLMTLSSNQDTCTDCQDATALPRSARHTQDRPRDTKLSLSELRVAYGTSDDCTESQLIELIRLALKSAPKHRMLCREITNWICENIATYTSKETWEGRVASLLRTHRRWGGPSSLELWTQSTKTYGTVHKWTLRHASEMQYQWDAVRGGCVPTSLEQTSPSPSASTPPQKLGASTATPRNKHNEHNETPMRGIVIDNGRLGSVPARDETPRMTARHATRSPHNVDLQSARAISPAQLQVAAQRDTGPPAPVAVMYQLHNLPTLDNTTLATPVDTLSGDMDMDIDPDELAQAVSRIMQEDKPKTSRPFSEKDKLLVERSLAQHKFDNAPFSSDPPVFDKAAKLEEIAVRPKRKQDAESHIRSRLKQTQPFALGLTIEPGAVERPKKPEPSPYLYDPLKGFDSQESQAANTFQECDNFDDLFGAPRDMIMMNSDNHLAWRDRPKAGERSRTRPKMICRTGRSTIEES